ncbi:type VI secretion system tube protein TssD [Saccharicrinis aurantiacus]|uniref:type VI secretion system tube protein TssD n=1 Tax=Saccharicrinis aurantiacus TaxID=1849719 RepID=UPI00095018DE|nr:type VI secretion system tube protein TssD [Saccharicrinis aurantiacus]
MTNLTTYLKLHKLEKNNENGGFRDVYELSYCSYELFKHTNQKGEASSVLNAGNIKIALPILPQDPLMKWLFNSNEIENGEISSYNLNSEVIEKISFNQARIVGFRFHYESMGLQNATCVLTINAQQITLGDNEYKNYWN